MVGKIFSGNKELANESERLGHVWKNEYDGLWYYGTQKLDRSEIKAWEAQGRTGITAGSSQDFTQRLTEAISMKPQLDWCNDILLKKSVEDKATINKEEV